LNISFWFSQLAKAGYFYVEPVQMQPGYQPAIRKSFSFQQERVVFLLQKMVKYHSFDTFHYVKWSPDNFAAIAMDNWRWHFE